MKYLDLDTERFILKVFTPDLVENEYLSWFTSKEATQYISYSKQGVTLEGLKKYALEKQESPDALFFGIFTKQNLQHIGNIKFEPINFLEKYAVMGILIGNEKWRGKGVFDEVNKILIAELKKSGIQKIFLGVENENVLAVKAYIKSGYCIDADNFLKMDLAHYSCMVKLC